MPLSPGTRLGPYEILALIGTGGMGEVYKARDTRLDRIVAVKTSKDQFSERFEREAQTVAALNHPHICTLHDVGPNYLVMEYLEGAPLRGPLPVGQAVQYAMQVCDALEAAHRVGITHRDLKPSNIMVTKIGIKLLDFGLAKTRVRPFSDSDETVTQAFTVAGQVIGTLQYMAPEQLQGKETDARSDIFSFGAVLYEILTGRRAFDHSDQASTITAVMSANPEPLPPLQPRVLKDILAACLAKDPDARFQTARDLKRALEWSLTEEPAAMPSESRVRRAWLAWSVAAVLGLTAAALAIVHFRGPGPDPARTIKFTLPPPDKTSFGYTSLSPDGSRLAFQARDAQGRARLFVQSMDSLTAQPLSGTEGASYPFWSPDGRFLGFFTGKQLKKIEASGGLAQLVCETDGSLQGATWGPDGTILFPGNLDGVYRVPASGGQPVRLTELDLTRKETRHYWPSFLPDGRHFLYEVISSLPEVQGVWVASLSNPAEKRRLLPDSSQATYALGHLLFVRGGNLMAQPFDPASLALRGENIPIVDHVPFNPTIGWADFSSSTGGDITVGPTAPGRRMTWFDRSGKALGSFGGEGLYQFVTLAPDQNRLAADAQDSQAGYELFVFDIARGTTTQLTFGADTGNFPVWSPDGTRVAFGSARDGVYNLYMKSSSGSPQDEVLWKSDRNKFLMDWSRDGRYLLFGERDPKTRTSDLWVLPLMGDRKPTLFLHSDADKRDGQFSPDGRWVAYSSDESKKMQVYVQSFPVPSERWQISTDGGARPRWRDDGKELYFMETGGRLLAVDVKSDATFRAATPKPLFDTGIVNPLVAFDVTKGGQRFVMPVLEKTAPSGPVTMIVNFAAGLKR